MLASMLLDSWSFYVSTMPTEYFQQRQPLPEEIGRQIVEYLVKCGHDWKAHAMLVFARQPDKKGRMLQLHMRVATK